MNAPSHASRTHFFEVNSFQDADHASTAPASGQLNMPLPIENVAAVHKAIAMATFVQVSRRVPRATSAQTRNIGGMMNCTQIPHSQFSHEAGVKIKRLQMNQMSS